MNKFKQVQNITDEDLFFKLQQYDNGVFEEIYDQYAAKLFHYIFTKMGDKKQSEDILQEVFIEFWSKKEQIQQSIYGFLFHITKCMVLNYFRSQRVRDAYILHFSTFMQDINAITPQKYVEAKEIMEQIEKLVEKLPPQCRKVFVMSRFEHKSNDDIAEELQISKRTVENYITKGLAFIRENNISIYLIISLFLDKARF